MKLKNKIKWLKFRIACFKVKRAHMKSVNCYLKALRLSLYHITKIGLPVNNTQLEILKIALQYYDESIEFLKKDADKCRKNISWYEEIKYLK